MINIMNSKLKLSAESKPIGDVGFTADNLIAKNENQRHRGFICSDVKKLPIELVFTFSDAINLKMVKLWPSLEFLTSTAFELHVRGNGNWKRVAVVKKLECGVDFLQFFFKNDYNCKITDTEETYIQKVFFFSYAKEILARAKSLKVVILATDGECSPVLGKIEIYGLVGRSLDNAVKKVVNSTWRNRHAPHKTIKPTFLPPREMAILKEPSSLIIPEEFLDAITWEIMVFPTILPSGKVVDKSTIDRHNREEANWRRSPSDPFTGRKYNKYHRAVMSFSLKERIDTFLMENPNHFESLPKSLDHYWMRRRHLGPSTHTDPRSSDSGPGAKRPKFGPLEYFASTLHPFGPYFGPTANNCISCRSAQFDFKINSCRHKVCRVCMIHLYKNQMCTCKVPFSSDDVERHRKWNY